MELTDIYLSVLTHVKIWSMWHVIIVFTIRVQPIETCLQ